MKPLLIAVLLAVMQTPSLVPGKAADNRARGSQPAKNHANDDKARPGSTPSVPSAIEPQKDKQEGGDVAADNAHQAVSVRELSPVSVRRDWLDWVAVGFTGALVIVGALGICYAVKTLRAIERSVKAAERSVTLQEIIQQQWVQIDGWRVEGRETVRGGTPSLRIVADISNPTGVPFTIEVVSATVNQVTYSSTIRNKFGPDDIFKADFPVTLTTEQIALYRKYALVLMIIGSVTYVDAFGRTHEQPFGQGCRCGPDGYEDFSPLYIPDSRQQTETDSAT